jgi:hypothetical protein
MTEATQQSGITQPARRTNFFDGRLLTAADLRREQDYQRGMRYLQNRTVGWGIVEGLDVTVTATGISISPGLAIDSLGRELVLAERVDLAADDSLLRAYPNPVVTATWTEVPEGALPSMDGQTGGRAFDSWLPTACGDTALICLSSGQNGGGSGRTSLTRGGSGAGLTGLASRS